MLYNLFENRDFVSVFAVALLAEGVDRNVRRSSVQSKSERVALLAEGVDRNDDISVEQAEKIYVALLAEGVDRNSIATSRPSSCPVALLAEGVDRNPIILFPPGRTVKSPSSRRAWIEITRRRRRCARTSSPSSRRAWIEIL